MARRWRQRLFPPASIANDIAEHKRLRSLAVRPVVRAGAGVGGAQRLVRAVRGGRREFVPARVERRRPRRGPGSDAGLAGLCQSVPRDHLGIHATAARAAGRV